MLIPLDIARWTKVKKFGTANLDGTFIKMPPQ